MGILGFNIVHGLWHHGSRWQEDKAETSLSPSASPPCPLKYLPHNTSLQQPRWEDICKSSTFLSSHSLPTVPPTQPSPFLPRNHPGPRGRIWQRWCSIRDISTPPGWPKAPQHPELGAGAPRAAASPQAAFPPRPSAPSGRRRRGAAPPPKLYCLPPPPFSPSPIFLFFFLREKGGGSSISHLPAADKKKWGGTSSVTAYVD